MKTISMGKDGVISIPSDTLERYKLQDGEMVFLDEREDGFLIRPMAAPSVEVEIYAAERLAEFFLDNSMSKEDYLEVRAEVEEMGIDPDSIDHLRWPD